MMKSVIRVTKISVDNCKIHVEFESGGDVSKVFKNLSFEAEYGEDIKTVPQSITIIPFIVNILPIAWVYDAEVIVDALDEAFYKNIQSIKKGYEDMYPKVAFGGKLTVSELPRNKILSKKRSTALLFSGGADATSSLITMLKRGDTPHLVTLWGADVALDDIDGWTEKSSHSKNIAELFNLRFSFVKTNFKTFINPHILDKKVEEKAGDKWWHGFQHGIGIIGHMAPLAYLHGFHETHIAASFTKEEKATCASDPTIDEHVRFADSKVIHNGYELTRQDKLKNIHEYVSELNDVEKLPIKVCWESRGAKNCGRCEKCMRTACGIIAEGGDVNFYDIEKFDAAFTKRYITEVYYFRHTLHWAQIQDRLRANRKRLKQVHSKQDISWLLDIDLNSINDFLPKRIKHYIRTAVRPAARLAPREIKELARKILKI